ncbi:hypothetical protein D3C79_844860 [compost metagenome]
MLRLKCVDKRLLLGLQHLHQQAALGALSLQGAQQPQLQRMMIGVVMLLPYQHTWRVGQLPDQLLRADEPAAGQVRDLPKLGVGTPFGALPAR